MSLLWHHGGALGWYRRGGWREKNLHASSTSLDFVPENILNWGGQGPRFAYMMRLSVGDSKRPTAQQKHVNKRKSAAVAHAFFSHVATRWTWVRPSHRAWHGRPTPVPHSLHMHFPNSEVQQYTPPHPSQQYSKAMACAARGLNAEFFSRSPDLLPCTCSRCCRWSFQC